MNTFMNISAYTMVLILFLQQVPALIAAAKTAFAAVLSFAQEVLPKISALFSKKS